MQKLLITASTIALLFGASTMATAQDRSAPGAQDPAAAPSSPMSPGAGAIKRDGAMEKDPAMQQRKTTEPRADSATSSDRSAGTGSDFRSYTDNKDKLSGASVAGGFTADQLIGANVLNATGDEIGEIEDLIVDSSNQVSKAIVEVGGFLGMGSKNVAVDIAQLKQGTKNEGFVTNMTKEELKTLPEYKKDSGNWIRTYK
jgi:sporulation protein YlmC with PRC-barrel domain